jgi:hypothetical protein
MLTGDFPPPNVEAEELRRERHDVTLPLAQLLASCVRSHPRERVASVLEVQEAIKQWFYLTQTASGGSWDAPPLPKAKKAKPGRVWWMAAAGVGLALCAYQLGRSSRESASIIWQFPPQNRPFLLGTPLPLEGASPNTHPAVSPHETASETLHGNAPQATKAAPANSAESLANQYETALRDLLTRSEALHEALQKETRTPTPTQTDETKTPGANKGRVSLAPRLFLPGEDENEAMPSTNEEEKP